jgi:hypothetical protein
MNNWRWSVTQPLDTNLCSYSNRASGGIIKEVFIMLALLGFRMAEVTIQWYWISAHPKKT